MRSYKKVNPLLSGVTASKNNKGLLLFNTDISSSTEVYVEMVNYDNTITGVTFSLGSASPGINTPGYPNYNLIPFNVRRWVDTLSVGIIGFELY
jgi:hypothetical protein